MVPWKWEKGDVATWTHTMSDGSPGWSVGHTVLNKFTTDGRERIEWTYAGAGTTWIDETDGVWCRRLSGSVTVLAKLPSSRGEILTIDSSGISITDPLLSSEVITYRTGALDTLITVPAGSFRCVEVQWTRVTEGVIDRLGRWFYAPGYGPVRAEQEFVGNQSGAYANTSVLDSVPAGR